MKKQPPTMKSRPKKEQWNVAIYHSTLPGINQDHHYFQFHIGSTNKFEKTSILEDEHSLTYVQTPTLKFIHEMQVPKRLQKEMGEMFRKQKKTPSFYLGHILFAVHHDAKTIRMKSWKNHGNLRPSVKDKVAQAIQFYPKGEPEHEWESWSETEPTDEDELVSTTRHLPYFGTWLERACYQWLSQKQNVTHVVSSGAQSEERVQQWKKLRLKTDIIYPIQKVLQSQEHLLEVKKPKKR